MQTTGDAQPTGSAQLYDKEMQRLMGLQDPAQSSPEKAAEEQQRQLAMLGGDGDEEEFSAWDDQLYGAMVKNARKKAGYSTAQAFSDTIYRRTRVRITRDVLYKIEQGRQTPDLRQFMAINIALYHVPLPSKITVPCMSAEWINIASNEGEIPLSWRRGNTLALEEATGERYHDGVEAARAAKDDPSLFGYGSAGAEQPK